MLHNIAVLGPGGDCSAEAAATAEILGRILAESGFVTVCGGKGGIYKYALQAADSSGGRTLVISSGTGTPSEYMEIFTGTGEAFKHALLSNTCSGAVLIGGWIGTMAIAFEFLAQKKPVIMLAKTGAAASTYAGREIIDASALYFDSATSPEEAIAKLKSLLKTCNP